MVIASAVCSAPGNQFASRPCPSEETIVRTRGVAWVQAWLSAPKKAGATSEGTPVQCPEDRVKTLLGQ